VLKGEIRDMSKSPERRMENGKKKGLRWPGFPQGKRKIRYQGIREPRLPKEGHEGAGKREKDQLPGRPKGLLRESEVLQWEVGIFSERGLGSSSGLLRWRGVCRKKGIARKKKEGCRGKGASGKKTKIVGKPVRISGKESSPIGSSTPRAKGEKAS